MIIHFVNGASVWARRALNRPFRWFSARAVADLCDEAAVEAVFSKYTFSAVIHFAGKKAVGESAAGLLTQAGVPGVPWNPLAPRR
jgi:UDP-glucose 4-epimerase